MSVPFASSTHQEGRRSRFLRPIRLSTFLLLMVVMALLIALYAQRLREAQLRDALSTYRNVREEGIIDALEEPIALTYADGAPLDDVLKDIKMQTTKNPKLPKLPAGLWIYVDLIGLQEAERSLNSTVKRPPSTDTLTLGEHLRRILEPLGLEYVVKVKDGYMIITANDSIDVPCARRARPPIGDEVDPYLLYRDVLR